jgi:uncharacterized protein with GYD domain
MAGNYNTTARTSNACYNAELVNPTGGPDMATYLVLANFTEQGVKAVKDTVKRAEAFREKAKKAGVTVKEFYWTLGQYDCALIAEAADDATMTAAQLSVAALGNIRTHTLRAFGAGEMTQILSKMM